MTISLKKFITPTFRSLKSWYFWKFSCSLLNHFIIRQNTSFPLIIFYPPQKSLFHIWIQGSSSCPFFSIRSLLNPPSYILFWDLQNERSMFYTLNFGNFDSLFFLFKSTNIVSSSFFKLCFLFFDFLIFEFLSQIDCSRNHDGFIEGVHQGWLSLSVSYYLGI